MEPKWYRPALNVIVFLSAFILLLISVAVSLKLFGYIFPALVPFIIAAFISSMIEPLVDVLQRRLRFSRSMAVMSSMLFVFGAFITAIWLLIIRLMSELTQLSAILPQFTREIRLYIEQVLPQAISFYGSLPVDVVSYLQDVVRNLGHMLQSLVEVAATSLLSVLSLVPGTVILIIVTILATYFIAKDRSLIADRWRKILPKPYGQKSIVVANEILNAFWSYLKAQGILISITMVQSIIGFYIIGLEYALTLGLVIGILDLIPVLGPATLLIPWAVVLMFTGNWTLAIKLLILYALIFVVRQMLEARVVAANLGLHPLATLLAMYIGLTLMGFLGLILGPIILIAIKAILKAGNINPGGN